MLSSASSATATATGRAAAGAEVGNGMMDRAEQKTVGLCATLWPRFNSNKPSPLFLGNNFYSKPGGPVQ